jgi:hypothetical protein
MEAFLTIPTPEENPDGDISFQSVMDYLGNTGVVFGVDEDSVRQIIEQKQWDRKVKVATGQPPVPGNDGFVEYHCRPNQEIRPKERDNGSVDFHDLGLVENVTSGQKLAALISPTDGAPGQNVMGKPIPAVKGKSARLLSGKNTAFTDESKTVLVSTANGYVRLSTDGSLQVNTVFTVDKHVDYNTGDIKVNGSVVVKGDVKAGFCVRASENIEIWGVVEDAEILAGGNITVRGGVVGQGTGFIKARGNVILNFIHNQKVSALGDILIEHESVQANLSAGGSIIMNKSKGFLIGGTAQATKSAEVNVVGNEQYANTVLIVGNTDRFESQIEQFDRELAQTDENLKKVKEKISELLELKMKAPWRPEMEESYRSMERLLVELPERTHELLRQKEALQRQVRQIMRSSFIKVNKRVYPGVSLKIAGCPRKFESEWGPSMFRVIDNELVGLPIV